MTKSTLGMILTLIAVLGLSTTAAAEIPRLMSFQGRLCNAADSPVNGNYDFTFNIYDVASGGAALWTEVQNGIPVENGVYNILLGSATALNLAFDTSYWLGVAVAPDAEMTPRYRLTAAPYAIYSETATTSATSGLDTGARYVLSGIFDTSLAGSYQEPRGDTTLHYIEISDSNIVLASMPVVKVYYEQLIGISRTGQTYSWDIGYADVSSRSVVQKTGGVDADYAYVAFTDGKIRLLYKVVGLFGIDQQFVINNSKYYVVIDP